MKKVFLALTGIAFLTGIYSFAPGTEKKAAAALTVNVEKSRIDWVAAKKSDFHTGNFPIKSGMVMVDGGKLTGGKFVIDLANLKVTDGAAEKLTGHLKSADFFDVAKFGEAAFEITSVNYTGQTSADINGNLTVKGITVPVKMVAQIRNADEKGFFAESFLTLDKTLVGINYGTGNVYNDVQLAVHIFAK